MRKEFPLTTIIKKFEGSMQPRDEEELQKWLEEDEANARILDDLKLIWDDVQAKTSQFNPDMENCWAKMQRHIDSTVAKPQILPLGQRLRQRSFLTAAAVAGGLLLGGSACAWLLFSPRGNAESAPLTYSALTGKSRLMLPDSTEVWLNAGSRIVYTSARVREVKLEGEAFFNVSHNGKPFVVSTGDIDVTVHGTQFNVDAYADCATTVVSLFEGSVSMQATENGHKSECFYLKPGEQGCFNKTDGTISIGETDGDLAKAWTSEKLKIENKNLRQVCAYLSAWYGVDITLAPDTPNDQSYTFTLDGQSLDEVMGIIKGISSIDYAYTKDKEIVITPITNP